MEYDAQKRRHWASFSTLKSKIIATDIDGHAVAAAKDNARLAGVEHVMDFNVCDFTATPIPETPGVIVFNPEYGERLGEVEKLEKHLQISWRFHEAEMCGVHRVYIHGKSQAGQNKSALNPRHAFHFLTVILSVDC